MIDFALIFRNVVSDVVPTPEWLQEVEDSWKVWMGGLASAGKLISNGNRLVAPDVRVVAADGSVTEGPYAKSGEFISGYIVVRAADAAEAAELAGGCPILREGGNVEVRRIYG